MRDFRNDRGGYTMRRHEVRKRPGRPSPVPDVWSVSANLTLPGRQYDEVYQKASRPRVTVPEQIRREMGANTGNHSNLTLEMIGSRARVERVRAPEYWSSDNLPSCLRAFLHAPPAGLEPKRLIMAVGPCSICQQTADREWLHPVTVCEVTCSRCGRYRITHSLDEWWKTIRAKNGGKLQPAEERLIPYLSAGTRQAAEPVLIGETADKNWKPLAERHMTTGVTRKLSTLLDHFVQHSTFPGDWVLFNSVNDAPLFDVGSEEEMEYLLNHLVKVGVLQPQETMGPSQFCVTVHGWQMAAPLGGGGIPGTCFVAMAFDPSLSDVYEEGIRPAVEGCGLNVVRVDKVEHNGIVTDLIMAEIRRSQIVVADVTLQRQGVYFEAGFALGLGRPVIWTCQAAEIAKVHFDTRQYSHVVWTDAADFKVRLEARIKATVLRSAVETA
jgi:hypothetical protein